MGLFGRIRESIREAKTSREAERKMSRWDKARQLEEEIEKVRRRYPNLTYEEAKVIAKKNLRKRKWRRRTETAKNLLKRAYSYYRRYSSYRPRRRGRSRRW